MLPLIYQIKTTPAGFLMRLWFFKPQAQKNHSVELTPFPAKRDHGGTGCLTIAIMLIKYTRPQPDLNRRRRRERAMS